MKKTCIILAGIFCFHNSSSQTEPKIIKVRKEAVVDEIFTVTEINPTYPGGEEAMFKYIAKNITYPDSLKDKDIYGKVYCQFIIEKDGTISDAKIVRSPHPGFDPVVLKAVINMPKWNPGMQRGKAVRVRYILPVNFNLR